MDKSQSDQPKQEDEYTICECCGQENVPVELFHIEIVSDKTEPEPFCKVCMKTGTARAYIYYGYTQDTVAIMAAMSGITHMLLAEIASLRQELIENKVIKL